MNWKIWNAALWIEIALSYFLPFKVSDSFQYQVGFPVSFITVWNTDFGKSPFTSMHMNPFAFLFNVCIFYVLVLACAKVFQNYTKNRYLRK